MKLEIVRIHKERKEAAKSAKREELVDAQLAREEEWNEARKATEAANNTLSERMARAKKEAGKKREDKPK